MQRSCFAVLAACGILVSTTSAAPPLKALLVDGQMNRSHDMQATSVLLKQQLAQTGLFAVDHARSPAKGQDMGRFRPDFAAYHVVVLNYDGDEWPEATKRAFVDYVGGGGGVVVYHSADNAFPNWREFNEMIAVGGWGGRDEKAGPYVRWREGNVVLDATPGPGGGHGPQHEFPLVVREPNHPVTRGLPPVFMHSADELYNRLRGPALNLTVLATAYSPPDKKGTGEHEPMLMAIRFGRGRIFHTALGHGPQQLKSVAFIATYQRGAEWAATGEVSQKVPADFPAADHPNVRP
ncbi:MAG: ThuA domain-containing protein [Pirellulales bacterium]|nr:ThuA domain-containing protein [Pirellulales bacterium]